MGNVAQNLSLDTDTVTATATSTPMSVLYNVLQEGPGDVIPVTSGRSKLNPGQKSTNVILRATHDINGTNEIMRTTHDVNETNGSMRVTYDKKEELKVVC